jgi:hypothetical protein
MVGIPFTPASAISELQRLDTASPSAAMQSSCSMVTLVKDATPEEQRHIPLSQ